MRPTRKPDPLDDWFKAHPLVALLIGCLIVWTFIVGCFLVLVAMDGCSARPPDRYAIVYWTAPTENVDGSPVELDGFVVLWGPESRRYTQSAQVEPGVTHYLIARFPTPGVWYFAVEAVAVGGATSEFSAEVSKAVGHG